MDIPMPMQNQTRVVIVGGGFAGLTLAQKLSSKYFQVVLLDRNNYHQFQPLLYQVATAGLEPSSISFPFRKIFQKMKNVFIRVAEVRKINAEPKYLETSIGNISYQYLVLANGAETNYYGNDLLQQYAFSMKSVEEALLLRNTLLQQYEKALVTNNENERQSLLNIVVVGGGPTGVELAGALAELKNTIIPKDYPELNASIMKVYLLEAAPRLLSGMDQSSAEKVIGYLRRMGVIVITNTSVKEYNGQTIILSNGQTLESLCLIWAAGVKGAYIEGIPGEVILPNGRLKTDRCNRLEDEVNIFAIGDIAYVADNNHPKGYPQVAQVAIQQAKLLAINLQNLALGKPLKPFQYKDMGSMATVGRNCAVAEIGKIKIKGFIAWSIWLLVHLMSIIGIKNRLLVLINWVWQYFTYDQSLRLILRAKERKAFFYYAH